MTFVNFLEEWKKDAQCGERDFVKLPYKVNDGQSLYKITYKLKVIVGNNSKTIEKYFLFLTQVEGVNDVDINPNADKFICQKMLDKRETEFWNEYCDYSNKEFTKMEDALLNCTLTNKYKR
jgi:hypothetical protein